MTREQSVEQIAKIIYGYACDDQKCNECGRGKKNCCAYSDATAIYDEIIKPLIAKNKELKADLDTWKRACACALGIKEQPCTQQFYKEYYYQHGDEECKKQFCGMNDEERLVYQYKEPRSTGGTE